LVLDLTNFNDHPGGKTIINSYKGKEITNAFVEKNHSNDAKEIIKRYIVGKYNRLKEFTLSEIESINKSEDKCYITIAGNVYDLSNFNDHPGSKSILMKYKNKDATKKFKEVDHSQHAVQLKKKFLIGYLKD